MKKISVIVPCYNVSEYIDRCVSSLVNQTIGINNIELIFVDDASTDDTLKKLTSWESKYPDDIMVVACEENGKQGTARNIGINYAGTDSIFFIDSDDWIEENTLEKMYGIYDAMKLDMVSCQMVKDFIDGTVMDDSFRYDSVDTKEIVDTKEKRRNLLLNRLGSLAGKLFRKNFILDNNIFFPENTAYEDNYFGTIMCGYISSYYIMSERLYHYVIHEKSTVTSKDSSHHLQRLDVQIMTLDRLIEGGFDKEYHEEIHFSFLELYYINSVHIFLSRFSKQPYDIYSKMKQEVLKRFPDYKQSKYYEKLPDLKKTFLHTLEIEMSEADWEQFAENYKAMLFGR